MKYFLIAIELVVLVALFCFKEKETEVISENSNYIYQNLKNKEIKYNTQQSLDINKDGSNDFRFTAAFVDETGNGKLEFKLAGENSNKVMVTGMLPKIFSQNEKIDLDDAVPFESNAKNVVLLQRIFTDDPAFTYWKGGWNQKDDKYLGVTLKNGSDTYAGWVRISYSPITSKIIIHECAVSKHPNLAILAGEKS